MTETWLKSWHRSSLLCSDTNYAIIRADRHDKQRGGGVCVFTKLTLFSHINLIESLSEAKEFDLIVFDLVFKNSTTRFISVYLPPDSSSDINIVTKLIRKMDKNITYSHTYIAGDFNFSKINWKDGTGWCSTSSAESDIFLDFLSKHDLIQMIDQNTHESGSILDLLIAPVNNNVISLTVEAPFTKTCDHRTIRVCVAMNGDKTKQKPAKQNFYKADYCKINDYLRGIDWHSLLQDEDIESNYNKFINVLQDSIQRFVPYNTTHRSKINLPKHLRQIGNKKKKLYKLSRTDPILKEEYRRLDKQYKMESKKFFNSLENKTLSSGNPKGFYNFVNKRLKSNDVIPPLIKDSKTILIDPHEKAELLNNFFTQCHLKDDGGIADGCLSEKDITVKMPKINLTPEDVLYAIKKLKCSVSRTPDNIPALYVKRTGYLLIKPLLILFKQSLAQGRLPSNWSKSIIVPIHKKGLRSSEKNYRPISLTSVFCRILECVIYQYIYNHLVVNNLISTSQHGFIHSRSTTTQQLLMLDALTENFDKRKQTEMILLDFSKAFDSISHTILLSILNQHKIDYSAVQWIKYLLSARTQQTIVEGILSTGKRVKSGVPQGSVIGPLLFNIYLNSLLEKIQSCDGVLALAFADDLKIISSDHNKLKQALTVVQSWCSIFKLKLNPAKSEHLCFREELEHTFYICSEPIKKVEQTRDLGVIVTNKLNWTPHAMTITSKANSLCYAILRTFNSKSVDPYVRAYKSYVRPILEFNTVIWNSRRLTETKILEKTQRLFTRKVLQRLNIKYNSYEDRLKILNLQSLEMRRLHNDLTTVFKISANMIDLNFNQFFSPITTKYNLRNHSLALQRPALENSLVLTHAFKYRVVKAWNSLSNNAANSKTLEEFKAHLKSANLNDFLVQKLL